MSECAAIVTRREDREMGKQGDRKARKQRAQEREQHRRQASANREPPAAPDAPVQRPDYSETDWDALRAAYPRDAERVKRAMFIVSAATEN